MLIIQLLREILTGAIEAETTQEEGGGGAVAVVVGWGAKGPLCLRCVHFVHTRRRCMFIDRVVGGGSKPPYV